MLGPVGRRLSVGARLAAPGGVRIRLVVLLCTLCTATGVGALTAQAAAASTPALTVGTLTVPLSNPLGALAPILSPISPITLGAGLKQFGATLDSTYAGLASTLTSVSSAVTALQANINPALKTAVTGLQSSIEATLTEASTLDLSAAGATVEAEAESLQAQVESELSALESLGLSNGLALAQQVLSPACSLTALPTSLTQGVGVSLNNAYPLSPAIQDVDAATDALIAKAYDGLYDTVLADIEKEIGSEGAILSLLQINWTTTYYPPNGGTPVVTTTPALLDVPTPLDVDGSTGFDLCGIVTIGSNGEYEEQISKMPLAKPTLPVDVSASLLGGLVNLGYSTNDSTAPIDYTTTYSTTPATGSTGAVTNIDNDYEVFRGETLSIPPPLSAPSWTLPPLTSPSPTPDLDQILALTAGSTSIQESWDYDNEPSSTELAMSSSPATLTKYQGAYAGAKYSFSESLNGTVLAGTAATPAPDAFQLCYSNANGTCSNGPDALTTDKSSLSFSASQSVLAQEYSLFGAGSATACEPSSVNLTGTQFNTSQTPYAAATATTPLVEGSSWVDSAGTPVSGCMSLGGITATLPSGFEANQRHTTFHNKILTPTPDSKSGTITCPTGTAITYNLLFALTPVVCSLPPANAGATGAPSITGSDYIDATLTANVGTWTPGVPNTPTYTYQWDRCSSSGTGCVPISGATGSTYVPPVGSPPSSSPDLGDTLEVIVTASNLDGTATATSAVTPVITLPPPPTNIHPPAITGIFGEGHVLTASAGTWANGFATETYTWLSCVASTCTPIPGQINNTTNTYTPTSSDEGNTVEVEATVTNVEAESASATSTPVAIPLPPVDSTSPSINDGSADATGQQVLAGDRLTALTGTWQNQTSFTYVWEDCSGGACTPINGATSASYSVQNSYINDTIEVVVTGHNANVGADGMATATSAATGAVLANDVQPLAQTDVPDGTVEATAPSSTGTAYVGGVFNTVGVPVGGAGAVAISATTSSSGTPLATTAAGGAALTNPAGFDAQATGGTVNTVISDGLGGYYLGGSFTAIQGTPCVALAHITSTGALDPTFCESGFASGAVVNALSTNPNSGLLAVGGSFTITTASNTGSNLVFIDDFGDGSNGTVLFPAAAASAPAGTSGSPNGTVYAISSSYSSTSTTGTTGFAYYIGGSFTSVGGTTTTGLVLETVTGSGAAATIGQTVAWPAALCDTSGTITGTGATAEQPCTTGPVSVHSLYYTTIGVLVGGDFGGAYTFGATKAPWSTDAYIRGDAASFGTGTASAVEGWNPLANGEVDAIALPPAPSKTVANGTYLGPYTVYLGGQFTKLGTASEPYLAEFGINVLGGNATTAASAANDASPSTSFTPAVNAPVYALQSGVAQGSSATIVSGGTATQLAAEPTATLYVGGAFTSLFGANVHRVGAINGQAAVLTTPATLDSSWEPNAGQTVYALANDGTNIFVGGKFLVLGGVNRQNLAEISSTTGVTGWNPGASGTVYSIDESNVSGSNEVYVGGSFTSAGGGSSPNLAAIDPVAGTATSWDPAPNGQVSALLPANGNIYIGGSFSSVDGTAEANVAAVSPTTGAPGTTPGTNGPVNALAGGPGGVVYIGGAFSSAGGASAGNLASINPNGTLGGFADTTDGPVQALYANTADLFVGGSFQNADSTPSPDAAAFSLGGGLDANWEPTLNGSVETLAGVGNTVYAGGAFTTVDGNADTGLVGLTADTATPTSFTSGVDGPVTSVTLPAGGGLIAGGAFLHVNGAFSPNLEIYGS
jgi:beta-propeller uncharacterized protein DUF5122